MATAQYPVMTVGGSSVIPTANGTLYTDTSMSANPAQSCQVYMEFFSDIAGTVPVTPTAGTISVMGTPMGNNYLTPSGSASVNATACGSPTSSYTPPIFSGRMVQGSCTFAGITGAPYARVTFWRY